MAKSTKQQLAQFEFGRSIRNIHAALVRHRYVVRDERYNVEVENGRVRLVLIDYLPNGFSSVGEASDWMPLDAFPAFIRSAA